MILDACVGLFGYGNTDCSRQRIVRYPFDRPPKHAPGNAESQNRSIDALIRSSGRLGAGSDPLWMRLNRSIHRLRIDIEA